MKYSFETENPLKKNWKEDRRQVKIAFMAEQLYRLCTTCHRPLHLTNCVDEHFGLGIIYSNVCSSCQNVTLMSSQKRHISTYRVDDKLNSQENHLGCQYNACFRYKCNMIVIK